MQVTEQEPMKSQAPVETEAPEVTKAPDELSPKFAALARKERALRSQAQALKAKEEALKAQESDYSTKYIPKDRLMKETLAVLQEQGITYDQLTGMILNQPGPQDIASQKLEAKIAELEAKLEKQVTSAQESQTKAYEQAVNQIRDEAKLLVDSDAAYETIKETDNVEAIVALIEETYKGTNKVLSTKDAAQQVEDYLVEEALKMAGLKKVKAKLSPQEIIEEAKPQTTEKPQIKTLTNDVTSLTKQLSNKDRRARAIAAFKGQLK
jgi:hypothetical protein